MTSKTRKTRSKKEDQATEQATDQATDQATADEAHELTMGVKNVRKGRLNFGGILRMEPGEVVCLNAQQLADERLMTRVRRSIEIGLLVQVEVLQEV